MGEMGAGSAAGMASLSPTMIERRRTVEKGKGGFGAVLWPAAAGTAVRGGGAGDGACFGC